MSRFWSPLVHDLKPYVAGEQPRIGPGRRHVAGLGWDSMAERYRPLLGASGDRPES